MRPSSRQPSGSKGAFVWASSIRFSVCDKRSYASISLLGRGESLRASHSNAKRSAFDFGDWALSITISPYDVLAEAQRLLDVQY